MGDDVDHFLIQPSVVRRALGTVLLPLRGRGTLLRRLRWPRGSYVSIAQFALKRDVRVVNCTTDDHRVMAYSREPEPEERERAVWGDIDGAFSQPATSGDETADYAPTQVIAEFFRENNLDGVAYGSSLGLGHN